MALPKYDEIMDLIKRGATLEAQEKIIELREAVLELREENFALQERIKKLEEQLKIKGQRVFERGVYWLVDGSSRTGPFCQRCLDVDEKFVRLHESQDHRWWMCEGCNKSFSH